jgi:hypothetical protein
MKLIANPPVDNLSDVSPNILDIDRRQQRKISSASAGRLEYHETLLARE